MTWQDALSVGSALVSIVIFFVSTLARESIGELKRRVGIVETRETAAVQVLADVAELKRRLAVLEVSDSTRAKEVAALDERSKGMTASLQRIEDQMVPRAEWEARHKATDDMLQRILDVLAPQPRSPSSPMNVPEQPAAAPRRGR